MKKTFINVNEQIRIGQEGLMDIFKSGEYLEFDFMLAPFEVIDYELVRVDKLFSCMWGEDNEGLLAQLTAYPEWYFDFEEDSLNIKIKRWWNEVNETLTIIKNINKNLNNSKTNCSSYKIYLKEAKHIFNINVNYLKSKLEFLESPSDYIDRDILYSPDGKKMMAEIMKGVHVFIREYNNLASKIVKKAKKSNEDITLSNEASERNTKNHKRLEVENFILKYISKLVTGNENVELYKHLFNSMNDQQFNKFMEDLRDGNKFLSVIIPNGSNKIKVDINNNIKLAKELGFDFFQRLYIKNNPDLPDHLTPNKYMLLKLPVRRASQLVSKKISIPVDNKSVDMLTGQVTGKSKGAMLTNPELQILLGLGLKDSIKELMKMRGGDTGEAMAMNNMLFSQGHISQRAAESYSTEVKSKKTLKSYFNGMGIKSTL